MKKIDFFIKLLNNIYYIISMNRIRLILVRHGQTEYNKLHKIQGSSNIDLDQTGRDQAKNIKLQYNIKKFYHTSLNRSRETLEIILKNYNNDNNDIVIEENDLLIERSYGIFEGLTENEIKEKYGDLYNKWKTNVNTDILNAEKVENVVDRINKFINLLITKKDKIVLCVTHSGVLHSLYKYINNINYSEYINIDFKNCSFSFLDIYFDDFDNCKKLSLTIDDYKYEKEL